MNKGTWVRNFQRVEGFWQYNWASDSFTITLNSRDRILRGKYKTFVVTGDSPEWGNWKLLRPIPKDPISNYVFCGRDSKEDEA